MLRADYIVLTYPRTEAAESAYPIICAYWLPDPVPHAQYGYRGIRSGKVFIGQREDRYLVQATGHIANDVAMAFPLKEGGEISVARIDVQQTLIVPDADFLIASCTPSKAYKAVRWSNVGERGETLYVGSPHSEVRLRIYNKTAESGLKPPSVGDYMRVEIQFRNRRADQMFLAIRARAPRFPFLLHLKRMIDAYTFDLVQASIKEDEEVLFPEPDEPELDAISRRKAWIERSVVPALKRILAEEPSYIDVLLSMLDNPEEDVVGYDKQ